MDRRMQYLIWCFWLHDIQVSGQGQEQLAQPGVAVDFAQLLSKVFICYDYPQSLHVWLAVIP